MKHLIVALLMVAAACRHQPKPPATTVADTVTAGVDSLEPIDSILDAPEGDTLVPRPMIRALVTKTATVPATIPVGLGSYKPDQWCSGKFSAGILGANAKTIAAYTRKAASCGFRIAWSLRDVELHPSDGTPFSLSMAKQAVDRLAMALPPDTLQKYRDNVLYLNIMDDLGSTERWSKLPALAELCELAGYAKSKLGTVPIVIRGRPDQLQKVDCWRGKLDGAVVQWATNRKDQKTFYDKNAALAAQLGIPLMVYSVNVDDCHGVASNHCTKAELLKYVGLALAYPGNYAFIAFKYDDYTWTGQYKEAWQQLLGKAQTVPAVIWRR